LTFLPLVRIEGITFPELMPALHRRPHRSFSDMSAIPLDEASGEVAAAKLDVESEAEAKLEPEAEGELQPCGLQDHCVADRIPWSILGSTI
jgi:hypothetical protein